jgi:hypothetical protein
LAAQFNWSIHENVAQMAVSDNAAHLHAGHARDRLVHRLLDDAFSQRTRERRPAAAGVELIPCAEQRLAGDHIHVDAVLKLLVVGVRMGPIRGRLLGHLEGLGRQ